MKLNLFTPNLEEVLIEVKVDMDLNCTIYSPTKVRLSLLFSVKIVASPPPLVVGADVIYYSAASRLGRTQLGRTKWQVYPFGVRSR